MAEMTYSPKLALSDAIYKELQIQFTKLYEEAKQSEELKNKVNEIINFINDLEDSYTDLICSSNSNLVENIKDIELQIKDYGSITLKYIKEKNCFELSSFYTTKETFATSAALNQLHINGYASKLSYIYGKVKGIVATLSDDCSFEEALKFVTSGSKRINLKDILTNPDII
jgi:hypothetical protein